MTISKFDKSNLKDIRAAMNAALFKVGQEYGIAFDIGRITFNDGEFRGKVSARIRSAAPAEKAVAVDEAWFAKAYGLIAGQVINGRMLVDCKPANRKYPFIYKDMRTGKMFKTTAAQAYDYFGQKKAA